MTIIQEAGVLTEYLRKRRGSALSIGFVPTMGALHNGHVQLVKRSMAVTDVTVCSIFVNPTQFNDQRDFVRYPSTIEQDIKLLTDTGVNVLFIPPLSVVYPAGTNGLEHYDIGYLDTILEGKYRPGHFQGVCQVMKRLLDHVNPHVLFMGQKDYQQCLVIKKLLGLLQKDVRFETCPTVREPDGLAMSSRNMRLNKDQRKKAPLIYQVLLNLKTKVAPGNLARLTDEAKLRLNAGGFNVEYVAIANSSTLECYDEWDGDTELVALVAAHIGDVRLIDNMLLNI